MTPYPPTVAVDRPVVGSYPTCTGAQRAVDFLFDSEFPEGHSAIIGTDPRMAETVLGRLTRGRAALAGAGAGFGFGFGFGLLIGLLVSVFAAGNHHVLLLMLSGPAYGAVFGAVFGFAGHALSGGHRDFSSRSQTVAARYDVVADAEEAEEAKNLLIKLAWREEGPVPGPATRAGLPTPRSLAGQAGPLTPFRPAPRGRRLCPQPTRARSPKEDRPCSTTRVITITKRPGTKTLERSAVRRFWMCAVWPGRPSRAPSPLRWADGLAYFRSRSTRSRSRRRWSSIRGIRRWPSCAAG
ncbi:general stress protein [Streptomyces europaeiscabiei]|uniref:general stress protein n=1 Tax=Streptomyces europaeiscabiei TaxID=146819 RepID=UPI002E163FDF|nr:hypothetical protein OHB30_23060 [Streptomyces europaeiscabiei]